MAWLTPMWNASKVVCCYGMNPMLKLHGDISHKQTCVCILIKDQIYCETVPLKSNTLSDWTYRLGGDCWPCALPVCVELSIDFYGNQLGTAVAAALTEHSYYIPAPARNFALGSAI